VSLVGSRGRGPVLVFALVAGAFLVGLLRPWDLLAPPAVASPDAGSLAGATQVPGSAPGADATATSRPAIAPVRAPTCASPSQWRTATIEDWTGRQARVWKAAQVVEAAGPEDPAIHFEPIVAATVTAIGWCAPVDGPDRPPRVLSATLYRIGEGGATEIPYDRLEPDAPEAQGELWVPRALGVGNRPAWRMGRYVIELRSPSGSYVRYLGLELTDRVVRGDAASPSPSPSPSLGAPDSPAASTSSEAASSAVVPDATP
jgi:hypothetical protein